MGAVTLLLLLTSSGGPKSLSVAIPATSDLTATADDRAAVSPVAEINVFSGGAATPESRAADQASAILSATADLSALLRQATERAAEQIITISDVVATLRNSTKKLAPQVDASSDVVATALSKTPIYPVAVVAAGSDVIARAIAKTPIYPVALIAAYAEVYIRIPPRSLGGAASPAAGRATAGSLTGSGRGVTGTATSASGR